MNETTEKPFLDMMLQPLGCSAFWANEQRDAIWQFAVFTLRLPEPVLVEGEPGEPVSMGVSLEGFDAEVSLTLDPALGRAKKQDGDDEERWYYAVSEIEVTVSRREVLPEGGEIPADHFQNLLLVYQSAAIEAANRTASFLKYRLWSPLFSAMERFSNDYGGNASSQHDDITQRGGFTIEPMEERLQEVQQSYFSGQYTPELADALLADAQQSILGQRLRRACLELTMACESVIKRRVAAAEQLKDAIDDSFKGRYQAAYVGLNMLFQARDDLDMGSPEGFFRFTPSRRRELRREQLKEWGASVTCLKNWVAPR